MQERSIEPVFPFNILDRLKTIYDYREVVECFSFLWVATCLGPQKVKCKILADNILSMLFASVSALFGAEEFQCRDGHCCGGSGQCARQTTAQNKRGNKTLIFFFCRLSWNVLDIVMDMLMPQ